MTNLFKMGGFTLNSGIRSNVKIECDALTEQDWATLAYMVSQKFSFSNVIGIPRGGLIFADALKPYTTNSMKDPWLIVDDVLTTGNTMQKERDNLHTINKEVYGVVVFSRALTPDWVFPIFTMWENETLYEYK